jgi:hypothetical protein
MTNFEIFCDMTNFEIFCEMKKMPIQKTVTQDFVICILTNNQLSQDKQSPITRDIYENNLLIEKKIPYHT